MVPHNQFSRILESLQDATLDDSRWPAAAGLIDEALGVSGNMIGYAEGCSGGDTRVFFARFCLRGQRRADLEREYFNAYFPHDERIPRLRAMTEGELVPLCRLFTEAERKTSRLYNDLLLRLNAQNSLSTRMDGPGQARMVWAIADPVSSSGWRSEQIHMIKRLLPHVQRFLQVRQALFDARAVGRSLAGLLDNTGLGVIQLNGRGRIMECNDMARAILRRQDGLLDRSGRLHARAMGDEARLQRVLVNALPAGCRPGVNGTAAIGRSSAVSRVMLYALPVGELRRDATAPRVAALAVLVDPEGKVRIDPGVVREVLGLTRAESQIAAKIASGQSVRDVALATERSESTIRSHVKRMLGKLGISRQAELVRRVLALKGIEL